MEIKGLETLTNLRKLELESNQITEIKGLDSLTKLKELIPEKNQINELQGLINLIGQSIDRCKNLKISL